MMICLAADREDAGEQKRSVPIAFTMPQDGFATIAIDDAAGNRVRNLIAEMPFKAGKNTAYWDGLDDDGCLMPSGEYSWKGLTRGPLHLAYQFSINTPNSPSWHTADSSGAWLADHSPPMGAFALGDVVYLSSPGPEANHGLIACDFAGKKLWGWRHGMGDGPTQMASDGKFLYCLSDQGQAWIYRFQLADGGRTFPRQVPFAGKGAFVKISEYDLGPWAPHTHGFAYRDGKLYVSHTHLGTILELDAESLDVLRKLTVPKPRGLAVGPDGNIYASIDKAIAVIDLQAGTAKPVITGLNEIRAIAFAPDGRLFAGDTQTSQVRVFAKQGDAWKETLVIGKASGGRGLGPYDPQIIASICALTVDKLGRAWVAEASFHPKRVSLWNGSTGELIREFVGPPMYGGGGSLDPRDPSRFVYNGVEFAVNWNTGAWRPANVLQIVPQPVTEKFDRIDSRGIACSIRYHGGRRLLVNESSWVGFLLVSEIANEAARPLSMAWGTNPPSGLNVWTDANGDGELQDAEVASLPPDTFKLHNDILNRDQHVWGFRFAYGRDFSIYLDYCSAVWLLPVSGWNKAGCPQYDLAQLKLIGRSDNKSASTGVDSRGNLIFGSPLRAMSPQGKLLWRYPNDWVSVHGSHGAPGPAPGRIIGALDMMGIVDAGGEAGEVFALNGNLGQQFLLTADGLFIASLFKDYRDRPEALPPQAKPGLLLDNTCIGPEPFYQSINRLPDGRIVVVCGREDSKVVEIQGLETVQRIAGKLTVSEEQVGNWRAAVQARSRSASIDRRQAGELTYPVRWTPMPIPLQPGDREKEFWSDEKPMALAIPGGSAECSLAYDAQNLYVKARASYRYTGLLRNLVSDPQQLAENGSGLEIRLNTAEVNDQPNILRVFFCITPGKPLVIVWTPSKANKIPAVVADAEVLMWEDQAWPHDAAYLTLRARVPLAALPGFRAMPKMLADVGLAWSAPDGTKRAGSNFWADEHGFNDANPLAWGIFQWGTAGAARPVYAIPQAKRAPAIDGKLDDWAGLPAVEFPHDQKNVRAWMQWSADTIFLAYEVKNSPPLKNVGKDWTMLFKTGGCVALELAVPDAAGKPCPQRLIIAMVEGKPVAALHRPIAGLPKPAGSEVARNVRYVSPVSEVTFDAVYRLAKVQVAVAQTADGYILEAAVPCEQLGLTPKPGTTIAGDIGVIISNETGSEPARRIYWSNRNTIVISDLPTEARLEPQQWGELRF